MITEMEQTQHKKVLPPSPKIRHYLTRHGF